MKTLYVSDLDGTLLNSNVQISAFTADVLNKAIATGAYFTVATARTTTTVLPLLSKLNINVPIVLMNGVAIYDITQKNYVKTHSINQASVNGMLKVLSNYDVTGFWHVLQNDEIHTYYEKICSEYARKFIEERRKKFNKKYLQIKSFSDIKDSTFIYFSVCDEKEKLLPLYKQISTDKNINIEFYQEIYEEGYWYLEISSLLASKYNAVRFLREQYQFDRVVSFGDNLNDLPLFRASDQAYAVENAKEQAKEKATGIIASNNNDGVAKWIMDNVK